MQLVKDLKKWRKYSDNKYFKFYITTEGPCMTCYKPLLDLITAEAIDLENKCVFFLSTLMHIQLVLSRGNNFEKYVNCY